jgi:hypothetical protein
VDHRHELLKIVTYLFRAPPVGDVIVASVENDHTRSIWENDAIREVE